MPVSQSIEVGEGQMVFLSLLCKVGFVREEFGIARDR